MHSHQVRIAQIQMQLYFKTLQGALVLLSLHLLKTYTVSIETLELEALKSTTNLVSMEYLRDPLTVCSLQDLGHTRRFINFPLELDPCHMKLLKAWQEYVLQVQLVQLQALVPS